MSYLDTLSNEQKQNIALIISDAKKAGITNPYSIAALLAIISKESSFVSKPERDYSNTSNSRIKKVFASKVGHLSDSEITALKKNPKAFFDTIYGGRYGNAQDEGFKYRGRGFNQITFKGSYDKYGKLSGTDIVNNPDSLLDPKVASKVAVAFAKDRIGSLKRKGKLSSYNANDINDFKNSRDAVFAFYHANTGTGKSVAHVKGLEHNTTLGGMQKALARVNDLVKATQTYAVEFAKKKPFLTVMLTATMVLSVFFLVKTIRE